MTRSATNGSVASPKKSGSHLPFPTDPATPAVVSDTSEKLQALSSKAGGKKTNGNVKCWAHRAFTTFVLTATSLIGMWLSTNVQSQAASSGAQISCNTAHISERWALRGHMYQQTYYCWTNAGTNVWSISAPMVYGDSTALGNAEGISFVPDHAKVQTVCPPAYGRARGYCDQMVTNMYFEQKLGWYDNRYPQWTETQVFYNGYAQCRNSIDANWVRCS